MNRLIGVLAALLALGVGSAVADVLVLRRDWTPTTCSPGGCTNDYPDTFSIDALYLSTGNDPTAQASCGGKAGLRAADLTAAGLARDQLSCAWQNYDPGLPDIQQAWADSWNVFGKCTRFQTAAAYLRQGLQLDLQYPLPTRLPETVQTAQLQRAIQAAFGERPVIGCDGNGQLRNIQMCFDPATLQPLNCPWGEPVACRGQLTVPRTGRGIGAGCTDYYKPSPVSAFLQNATASQLPPPVALLPPAASPSLPPPAPSPSPPVPSAAPPAKAPPAKARRPPVQAAAPEPGPPPVAAPAQSEAPQPAQQPAEPAQPEQPAQQEEVPAGGGGDVPGEDAAPAPTGNQVLDPQGSSGDGSGSGGSASMGAALGGGIVGGLLVGLAVFGGGYYMYRRGMRAGQASNNLLGSPSVSGSGSAIDGGSSPWVKGMDGELAAAEAGGKWAPAQPAAAATAAGDGQLAGAEQSQPAPLVYYGRLPPQSLPVVHE